MPGKPGHAKWADKVAKKAVQQASKWTPLQMSRCAPSAGGSKRRLAGDLARILAADPSLCPMCMVLLTWVYGHCMSAFCLGLLFPKSDAEPLSVRTVLEAEQQLAPGISEPLSEAPKLPHKHATCWSFTLPVCLHIDECNLDAHCTKLDLKRTSLHKRLI